MYKQERFKILCFSVGDFKQTQQHRTLTGQGRDYPNNISNLGFKRKLMYSFSNTLLSKIQT
jgi:hypothetical protein